jgi:antitoxin YefM
MSIPASEARAKLFPLIQQVNDDAIPVLITSKAGNAVLISESEYESLMETMYLISNPNNYKAMMASIADASEVVEFPFTAKGDGRAATKRISAAPRRLPAKRVVKKKVSK